MWVSDRFFEACHDPCTVYCLKVLVKASARSSVRSNIFPQLRVRLRATWHGYRGFFSHEDLVFGPVPIAVAMEAAPQASVLQHDLKFIA